jgi:hypothetical protein
MVSAWSVPLCGGDCEVTAPPLSFAPGSPLVFPAGGLGPSAIAIADLDLDGDLDLAVALRGNGSLAIHFNDGQGTFPDGRSVLAGSEPRYLQAGDFDGDGAADVLVLASELRIFFNNRTWAFPLARTLPAPPGVGAARGVDLDLDGDLDVVAAAAGEVAWMLNDGRGVFQGGPPAAAPQEPIAVDAGDLDADGVADVAVLSQGGVNTARVTIFQSTPEGALLPLRQQNMVGGALAALWIANLDLDGRPDILTAAHVRSAQGTPTGAGRLQALRNVGLEGFVVHSLGAVATLSAVLAEDLDGDGAADLVLGLASGKLLIYLANGDLSYHALPATAAGGSPGALAAADLDQDGVPDVVAVSASTNEVTLLRGLAGGEPEAFAFAPGVVLSVTAAGAQAAADFDGDGATDFFAIPAGHTRLAFFPNRGDGSFPPGTLVQGNFDAVAWLPLDADGDGKLDLAVLGQQRAMILSNAGGGNFQAGPGADLAIAALLATGDLDGDGAEDLVAAGEGGALAVHLAAAGILGAPALHPLGAAVAAAALADLDGDGDLDIAAATAEGMALLRNDGRGSFAASGEALQASGRPAGLAAADLDGDGSADLAVVSSRSSTLPGELIVLWSAGDPRSAESSRWEIGRGPGAIAASDLDRDGRIDLVVSWLSPGTVAVFAGKGERRFEQVAALAAAAGPLASADLDGDGHGDLIVSNNVARAITCLFQRPRLSPHDRNRNGIHDACERLLFHRGDADAGGRLDLTDAVFVLEHLFRGGVEPPCLDAADADDDGRLALTDALFVLLHLFAGGPPPPPPGPPPAPCGPDPEAPGTKSLGCRAYGGCP